jgi:(R)-amidase
MARAQENQAFARDGQPRGRAAIAALLFAGGSALVDPLGTLMCMRPVARKGSSALELDLSRLAAARKDYRYLDDQRLKLTGGEG